MLARKARPLTLLRRPPWPPSPVAAPRLDSLIPAEEEKTPYYDPSRFYPAYLGQVLHERYQIATKLGHGSTSTVWLARDLDRWRWSRERYVAVKINTTSHHFREDAAENELAILNHISRASASHQGRNFVRKLLDSFIVNGASDAHLCLVFEPLREPLWLYCKRFVGGVIPSNVLKVILQMILHGLDYLHSECQVIHADLKPDNVMVKVEDPAILEKDARDEYCNPLPQKLADGRTIYLSRNNYGQFSTPAGVIQITDFGFSVSGTTRHTGCIQAEAYRAPEVILDAGYTYSAEIWSLGVMMWDLIQGNKLFNLVDQSKGHGYDDLTHLAQLGALLGPPPEDMLSSGSRTSLFYRPDGSFRGLDLTPNSFSFESTINTISGEEKEKFLEFVKKMIRWNPAERSTAKDLLCDPWLYTDFAQDAGD